MSRRVKQILSVFLVLILCIGLCAVYASADEDIKYLNEEEAVVAIREIMKERQTEASIYYTTNLSLSADFAAKVIAEFTNLFPKAYAHTGNPCEGDYLFYQYLGAVPLADFNSFKFVNGKLGAKVNMTLSYRTTAEQEQLVDAKVSEVLQSLNLDGKSTYEKVKAIYDWIGDNVVYDYNGLVNYATKPIASTAYAALINGTAVCQGYSVLFYRLCLEEGIDARVIQDVTGGGMPHVWNIVKMDDGKYYYIDTTLGAGVEQEFDQSPYAFFLKGSTYWSKLPGYTLGDQYTNETLYPGFAEQFPISKDDYCVTDIPDIPDTECHCTEKCEHEAAVKADCKNDGHIEYWYCPDCETYYSDADCTAVIDPASIAIPVGHTNIVVDPAKPATCTECGLSEGSHCTACGATIVEQKVLQPTGHKLQHVSAKSASALSKGNTEYWKCSVCGQYFSDSQGNNPISQADTVIPATGITSIFTGIVRSITNILSSIFRW